MGPNANRSILLFPEGDINGKMSKLPAAPLSSSIVSVVAVSVVGLVVFTILDSVLISMGGSMAVAVLGSVVVVVVAVVVSNINIDLTSQQLGFNTIFIIQFSGQSHLSLLISH